MAKTAVLKPFLAIATDKMKAKTVAELQARTEFKEGDVVEVLGELVAGDGKHHMRIASKVADASGVQGQGGLFWNVVPNSLISLIAQAIEQNKSDILLKRDKTDKNFGNDLELETLGHITRIAKGILEKDKQELYRYLPQEDKWYKIFDEGNCPISKSPNGWCKLANGLIVQWGSIGNIITSDSVVNMPISFTGVCVITGSIVPNAAWTPQGFNAYSTGGNSFSWNKSAIADSNVGNSVRWLAIGY